MSNFSIQIGEGLGRFWRRLMEPRLDKLETSVNGNIAEVRKDIAVIKESLVSGPFDPEAFDRGLEAGMQSSKTTPVSSTESSSTGGNSETPA